MRGIKGCTTVALPPRFERTLRIGGQYALWTSFLLAWLQHIQAKHDGLAIRAISARPAQLNRDIADDELDVAILYEPVRCEGLRVEQLASDRLVLLTSRPNLDWRGKFYPYPLG